MATLHFSFHVYWCNTGVGIPDVKSLSFQPDWSNVHYAKAFPVFGMGAQQFIAFQQTFHYRHGQ
ncbi:MAG: hypothetical protein R2778_03575 [Saprospiraceae bacterium]